MVDIQFDSEQEYVHPSSQKEPSGLIGLVRKLGLAKDGQHADYILIGIAGVAILLTMSIWFFLTPSRLSTSLPVGTLIPGPDGEATFTR